MHQDANSPRSVVFHVNPNVSLNVGGQVFLTRARTLLQVAPSHAESPSVHEGSSPPVFYDPPHVLAELLIQQWQKERNVPADSDTSHSIPDKPLELFVDRDSTHFRHVLNYLREGSRAVLPCDCNILRQLILEADFYHLQDLKLLAQMKLASLTDCCGGTSSLVCVNPNRVCSNTVRSSRTVASPSSLVAKVVTSTLPSIHVCDNPLSCPSVPCAALRVLSSSSAATAECSDSPSSAHPAAVSAGNALTDIEDLSSPPLLCDTHAHSSCVCANLGLLPPTDSPLQSPLLPLPPAEAVDITTPLTVDRLYPSRTQRSASAVSSAVPCSLSASHSYTKPNEVSSVVGALPKLSPPSSHSVSPTKDASHSISLPLLPPGAIKMVHGRPFYLTPCKVFALHSWCQI